MQLFSQGVEGCQRPEEKVHKYVINQTSSCDNE